MLNIAGTIALSFDFPANLPTSMRFFDGLERLAQYLPHIDFIKQLDDQTFRLMYNATELSAYHIRIFTDVRTELSVPKRKLLILPAEGFKPVPKRAAFNSSTGQGYYASRSTFTSVDDDQTKIDFQLELKAQLPRPKGLRFMPATVVNGIAQNITEKRMQEIADGFVVNAKAEFSHMDVHSPQRTCNLKPLSISMPNKKSYGQGYLSQLS